MIATDWETWIIGYLLLLDRKLPGCLWSKMEVLMIQSVVGQFLETLELRYSLETTKRPLALRQSLQLYHV